MTTDAVRPNPPHCAECGSPRPDSWILHNVRHKSTYRLLCTHCLLSSFRGHFCHHCFDVFLPLDSPSAPRASQRVLCLHCPSISHLSCLNPGPNSNPNSAASSDQFRCPMCADPEFRFFRAAAGDGGGKRVVKRDALRVVVAAARIASETVRKGAITARVEAEKRVKEAAVARKRAREALERVAYLSMRDKEKKGAPRDSGVGSGKEGNHQELKVAKLEGNERSNDVGHVKVDTRHGGVKNGVNNGGMDAVSVVTPRSAPASSDSSVKKEISGGHWL
ncbi:hypothetical protein MLD38_017918 [Melastoma candidum]|uniref:Uncharacterized protein n=1 Tax=Melastoma candidum TaxID=119954 RepID=A0ACB9QW92_9MYRT|nr:hypothetical protein MLD38_017918 [Melastoma candidum]